MPMSFLWVIYSTVLKKGNKLKAVFFDHPVSISLDFKFLT